MLAEYELTSVTVQNAQRQSIRAANRYEKQKDERRLGVSI